MQEARPMKAVVKELAASTLARAERHGTMSGGVLVHRRIRTVMVEI